VIFTNSPAIRILSQSVRNGALHSENARRLEVASNLLIAAEERTSVRRALPAKLRAFPFNLAAPMSRLAFRVLSYALKDQRIAIHSLVHAARECVAILVDDANRWAEVAEHILAKSAQLDGRSDGSRDTAEFVQLLGAHQRIVNAVLDGLAREFAESKAEQLAEITRLTDALARTESRLAALERVMPNGSPLAMRTPAVRELERDVLA